MSSVHIQKQMESEYKKAQINWKRSEDHKRFQDWLSKETVPLESIVYFGLGSFSHEGGQTSSYNQFSQIMTVKETLGIKEIFMHDPYFTKEDRIFLQNHGCIVLKDSEEALDKISRKSIVHMMNLPEEESKWARSKGPRVIICDLLAYDDMDDRFSIGFNCNSVGDEMDLGFIYVYYELRYQLDALT